MQRGCATQTPCCQRRRRHRHCQHLPSQYGWAFDCLPASRLDSSCRSPCNNLWEAYAPSTYHTHSSRLSEWSRQAHAWGVARCPCLPARRPTAAPPTAAAGVRAWPTHGLWAFPSAPRTFLTAETTVYLAARQRRLQILEFLFRSVPPVPPDFANCPPSGPRPANFRLRALDDTYPCAWSSALSRDWASHDAAGPGGPAGRAGCGGEGA
jgi:hypothetical protein